MTLPRGETPGSIPDQGAAMDELLSIGRFSRMCWLSVKALRLYDETGLLSPAYVDPVTGYRYYTDEQAPVARAIAILRSLDMPLQDIKPIVTETDPDAVRALLDAHRIVLEQRIERHRHMLQRVENFIRKGAVMTYEITTRNTAPTDVIGLTFSTSPEAISTDAGPAYHRIYDALSRVDTIPAGPPRMVYHAMEDEEWTIEVCVPVPDGGPVPDGLTRRRMDGGRAARAVHVGPYNELGMAYREMEVWIGKQGLTPAALPYDVYLNDPAEVKDPAKYETEIVWPVR
ncbi:MerR family transcriptional regulator [Phytoactinopolyspora mesophila]|uniref:MerR family transcriptional regulator n=1 Tax=Phytoactinopolyspora mesophila TaxID=2650750 RepID=A0A7K3LX70_9ACTN|nr:MerR family transcriptional regulator [Phytoactinopolyspora mesophila]NDL55611.1 MerR family transcriptional regulator [Phytoactinopolyspora mesophila]